MSEERREPGAGADAASAAPLDSSPLTEGAVAAAISSVLVVGGGIAGLVVARDLALAGLTVTVLEATDHLGGKVARHIVAGLELDAGAESFATRRGIVAETARQLGLHSRIVQPNPDGAWLQNRAGVAFPLPKTGILGIPGMPLAADVIRAIGLGAAVRAQLDGLLFGFLAANERNLGRLVRRRMGRRVLEQLVAPVTLGIHSKHPNDLDVDVVAPGLRAAMLRTGSLAHAVRQLRRAAPAGSAVNGISGGVYELVVAFERDLERFGVDVRLSSPVHGVDAAGVTLSDGSRIEADRVVVATSLTSFGERNSAISEVNSAAEPVPNGAESELSTIVLVTLVVHNAQLDVAPRGTGLLVAPGSPGVRAKALTHATAKWNWLAETAGPGAHVLRLSYNDVSRDGLREQARVDAGVLLNVDIRPADIVGFAVVEWRPPAGEPASIPGVVFVGEGVAGTGLAAVISHAHSTAAGLLGGVVG